MKPDGWAVRPLRDLVASVTAGVSVNSESRPRRVGEIGVLKTSAVTYGTFDPQQNKVVIASELARARAPVKRNTILISRMNTVDLVAASVFVRDDHPDLVLPDRIWMVEARPGVDPRWLQQCIASRTARQKLSGMASGTSGSMKNLSQEKFLGLEVLVPPAEQQRKIAVVLDSVDDTIEAALAMVHQQRLTKTALLDELLARGLPKWRASFKPAGEWRLGKVSRHVTEIPEHWELTRLCTVARLESGHTPSRRHPEYWKGDIPWISLHDSKQLDVPTMHSTARTIGLQGLANSSARLLPAGTVVLSRTATVGKSTVMGREMATSQDFANYVCGDRLHNRYLMHVFRHMQPEWERLMAGSTHQTIYMPVFRELQVLLPPLEEQEEIARVGDALEAADSTERRTIASLREMKQCLAASLLSGSPPKVNSPEQAA